MKIINQICRILTAVLAVCATVLFFFPFLSVKLVGEKLVPVSGAEMAFGAKVTDVLKLQVSSQITFIFVLCAFSALMAVLAIFSKKGNGTRIASFVASGIAGVYMLVVSLSKVQKYSDLRPAVDKADGLYTSLIPAYESTAYESIVLIAAIVILATFVIGVIAWLVNDYVLVLASKGQRISIFGKVKAFIRENIAEIKRIVWPSPKAVVRNSIIVLIICAILGAFIWIVDYALLKPVLNFITKL